MKKMVGVAVIVTIIAVDIASGSTSFTNRNSTRTFLGDATRYLWMRESRRTQVKIAVRQFIDHVEARCPHVLASGSTNGTRVPTSARETFLHMAVDDLILAGLAKERTSSLVFATGLGQLRWNKLAVTRAVAHFQRSLVDMLALRSPSFCVVIENSATTGFTVVPGDATQFVAAFDSAVKTDMGYTVGRLANMMRAFLSREELSAVEKVRRLESRVDASLELSEATLLRLQRAILG